MADIEKGYLDTLDSGYLAGPYLAGEYQDATGMQVNMVLSTPQPTGMQAQMVIDDSHPLGFQALMIALGRDILGMQVSGVVNFVNTQGMQAQMITSNESATGMQVLHDTLRHALLEQYLVEDYLTEAYLVDRMGAFMGMQALMTSKASVALGMQAQMIVNDDSKLGMQSQMIVDTERVLGMQANRIAVDRLGMQATMVIYNNTQFRIMDDFPSRGTAALLGMNWTADSQASGEYYPYNVNTDIIEQVYRSGPGSASLVTLVCDTGVPQGVPVDTIAILGHTFTKSALVQVQGSNDNFATPANIVINMTTELENMYYISPTFPTAAGQNRYWKFIIQDSTNPAGQVDIGAILFGTANIFSVLECFANPVVTGFKHFKDELRTEGFTTVSNDRALKKYLRLSFEKLNYFKGNYRILQDNIKFARTSLKSLVIPTPQYPSRFAVFAKLAQMPEITHADLDPETGYVDLSMEWDESL